MVRRGFDAIKIIDLVMSKFKANFDVPEIVFEGFKVLALLGGASEEHLANIRSRGSELRRISLKFPMPDWLTTVAWNL